MSDCCGSIAAVVCAVFSLERRGGRTESGQKGAGSVTASRPGVLQRFLRRRLVGEAHRVWDVGPMAEIRWAMHTGDAHS